MKPIVSYPLVGIRDAKCHGKGAFAKSFIPKGTRVIEYVGEKITSAEGEERIEECEKLGTKNGDHGAFYIFELNKRHDLDGNVGWNVAKFLNHSCQPNCESDTVRGRIWILAKKDIKEGDELTYDYGFGFDSEETLSVPCKCGAEKCVGYILDKDERPKLKRYLAKKSK